MNKLVLSSSSYSQSPFCSVETDNIYIVFFLQDCIFLQKRLMELNNGETATNNLNDPREQETYVYIKGRGVIKKSELQREQTDGEQTDDEFR